MPFKTGLVFTYDCGEFENNLNDGLEMIDYAGFEARRVEAETRERSGVSEFLIPLNVLVGHLWRRLLFA